VESSAWLPAIGQHQRDELLVSLAARTAVDNVLPLNRDSLDVLFGSRNYLPGVDLPGQLSEAFTRFGAMSGIESAAELARSATHLPYYGLSLPRGAFDRVARRLVLGSSCVGLKQSLGSVVLGYRAAARLRRCNSCDDEAQRNSTVTFWSRSHALPCVQCCHIHGEPLFEAELWSWSSNRYGLLFPSMAHAPLRCSVAFVRAATRFAQLSADLLKAATVHEFSRERCIVVLRQRLLAYGFMSANGRLLWIDLRDALLERGTYEAARHAGGLPLLSEKGPPDWLRAAIGTRPSKVHPVFLLALVDLLFASMAQFIEACREIRPIDGPAVRIAVLAPARAPSADQHDSEADDELRLIRDASLSCTEVAKALQLSVNTVVKRRRALGIPIAERKQRVTEELRAEVLALLSRGEPIQVIAGGLTISSPTIYRELAASRTTQEARSRALFDRIRESCRARWANAVLRQPSAGVAEIRRGQGASYAWLRRHDGTWLREHSPAASKSTPRSGSVDWPLRDRLLSELAKAEVQRLTAIGPKRSFGRATVLRKICPRMSWLMHMHQLPRLTEVLTTIRSSGTQPP
jgi:hypothetical protein